MDSGQKRKIVSFEDFDVFERAFQLSLAIHKQTLQFPQIEQFALAQQMRNASKSICANIAEGYGKQKQSSAEFKRFLNIALGSSDEMRVWLRYAHELAYITQDNYMAWRSQYIEISRMLQKLISRP